MHTSKQVKGKTEFTPIAPQPSPASIVVIQRYYTSLKLNKTYKKRVTWFGEGSGIVSRLAVVEYVGKLPGNAPHGNNPDVRTEYLRTPTYDMLRSEKPRTVYDKLKKKYDEVTRPTCLQQLRDRKKSGKPQKDGPLHTRNVADHFSYLENLVSDSHAYVRWTFRLSGKTPCIILHRED